MALDADQLMDLASTGDAGRFAPLLCRELALSKSHYHTLLVRMREERAVLQTQPEHTTAFILDSLEVLLPLASQPADVSADGGSGRVSSVAWPAAAPSDPCDAVTVSAASAATAMHLLLDLTPGCLERVAAAEAQAAARARAAALLRGVLAQQAPPRLALKAAQAFWLAAADVAAFRDELAAQVRGLLEDAATATPAVGLLRHFQELQHGLDVTVVLQQLVRQRHHALAEDWAATMERCCQVALVELCIEADDLKQAVQAAQRFALLDDAFPGLERTYKSRTIGKLAVKRQWAVAAAVAGDDPQLQEQLVLLLMEMGEPALAQGYAEQFGLPAGLADAAPAAVAAAAAQRAAAHLPLRLPPDRVLLVDDEAQLDRAAALLAGAPVLGIDCEWQPAMREEESNSRAPVAILQVASANAAVVFDLQTLGASAALDACLASVLGCSSGSGNGSSCDGSLSTGSGRYRGPHLPGMGRPVVTDVGNSNSNGNACGAVTTADHISTGSPRRFPEDASAASAAGRAAAAGNGNGDARQPATPGNTTDWTSPLRPPVKCGVGVSEDLTRLARTHPGVKAFRRIPRVLDLRHPWQALQLQQVGGKARKRGAVAAGLSAMTHCLLGKPLDKSQQVSSWAARPLTPAQLQYAALDAHAAVLIHAALAERGMLGERQQDAWAFDFRHC